VTWRRWLIGLVVILAPIGAWLYIDSDEDVPEDSRSYLPDQATVRTTLDGLAAVDPAFADAVNFQVLGSVLCRGLEDDREPALLRQIVRAGDTRPKQLSDADADRVVSVYRDSYCPKIRLPQ
jgi:hypothetical protein